MLHLAINDSRSVGRLKKLPVLFKTIIYGQSFSTTFLGSLNQHTLSDGRAIKSGLSCQLCIDESRFSYQGQEILSRYGPAFSAKPAFDPGLMVFSRLADQDLIGYHQPSLWF